MQPTPARIDSTGKTSTDRRSARARDEQLRAASDDSLLTLARQRHPGAFGELYRRHRGEAYRYARVLSFRHLQRDATDDVVAEAMRKILAALLNGRGPRSGFRPYLITTIRNVAYSESMKPRGDPVVASHEHDFDPAADDQVDTYVAVQAFATLPQRSRAVLWLTEALKLPPSEAAALLDTAPGNMKMLALRARDALRVAYVRQHLPSSTDATCSHALDLLARRPLTTISIRQTTFLDLHLTRCTPCRHAAAQVDHDLDDWHQSRRTTPPFDRRNVGVAPVDRIAGRPLD